MCSLPGGVQQFDDDGQVVGSKAEVSSCLQCVSSKEEPLPACEHVGIDGNIDGFTHDNIDGNIDDDPENANQGSSDQAKPCEEGRNDGCQVQVIQVIISIIINIIVLIIIIIIFIILIIIIVIIVIIRGKK